MSDTVVGYSRFDPYGRKLELEVVDEPFDFEKFKANIKPKKEVIDANDYNFGTDEKKKPEAVIERKVETVEVKKHTAHDLEVVDVELEGKHYRIPRYMVKYLSGPC
jgi:hypothetical protein